MIEMLCVLAIIAILSIGGIAGYAHAMKKQRLNRIREQITQIVMNVKTLYATQGDFNDLTTESAINAGIIPSDMKITDSIDNNGRVVKHIYNGDFIIEGAIDLTDGIPVFMVILTGLPREVALDISTADWKNVDGLMQIAINSDDL